MCKSEEIIKDWYAAKELCKDKIKLNTDFMTMSEIVRALIDNIDDLKEEIKDYQDSYRYYDRY